MAEMAWWLKNAMGPSGIGWNRRRESSRKGKLCNGSSTEKVLAVITDASPRYLSRAEIVIRSECPAKSVDWALHYLRSINRIKCQSMLDQRSSLYLKWGIGEDGG